MAEDLLYPRCAVSLAQGDIVVCFHPGTLASIEAETGKSFLELAKEFSKGAGGFSMYGIGLPIIFGAIKAMVPDMTKELLAERIKPGTYMKILTEIMDKLGEAVKLEGDAFEEADKADPPKTAA